ncbi:MAG: Nramp family divalent metal transporter [Candidatus Altiarchaeota archaeon]
MDAPKKIFPKRLALFLAVLGPGIITASVDNDAGGITTYSIAGAHFGYQMLWSLIPITFFLVIVQEMAARMGVVTGKGLADLIRENFGLKITFIIMICLVFANLAVTVSEFAGIAAAGELFGLSKYVFVPVCVLFVLGITMKLDYRDLEKFFLLLVFFYVSYVLSGYMAAPDWSNVFKQTVTPSFEFSAYYLAVLVGVIGTTITPWMQFYLQSSIVEKGVKKKEYKYSRMEVILGCITTDVIAFFIIVTCAATLFKGGVRIDDAVDAAKALAPLAGNYASIIFAAGFFGAALFGAIILPISTSFYVCEAFGWESGVNKKVDEAREFYAMMILITVVAAAVVLIPKIPLITLMISSQIINGLMLPLVLICMLKLVNNRKIMGEYVNSRPINIITWTGCIIIILVSLLMVASTLKPELFTAFTG